MEQKPLPVPAPPVAPKIVRVVEDPAVPRGEIAPISERDKRPAYDGDTAFKLYLREIGQVKLLTPLQEIELAARIKKGDKKAREDMIKANLRRVVKIAHDYEGFGLPLLDLINEGNIGLMKAVERFDPAKGGKLSTYSAWWIKQTIKSLPLLSSVFRDRDLLVQANSDLRAEQRRLRAQLSAMHELQQELAVWKKGFVPPGHYYSPVPDMELVQANGHRLFAASQMPTGIAGTRQANRNCSSPLRSSSKRCPSESPGGGRYYLNNDFYAYSTESASIRDALTSPRKFIEIGSGYSSCAALDTAEMFLPEMPISLLSIRIQVACIERFRPDDLANPRENQDC